MEDIPNPIIIVIIDGIAPIKALPIFVVLHVVICIIMLTQLATAAAAIGNPNQSTRLNTLFDKNEALKWKSVRVINKKNIAIGIANVKESITGTFMSGLDITNRLGFILDRANTYSYLLAKYHICICIECLRMN